MGCGAEHSEDQVDTFIDTLEPGILGTDTPMTNHGLRDGSAFPVRSTLTAGTAVLVDTSDGSTTTTYYDETTTTEYYPTASEPPYTEPEPGDYEPIPPTP